MERILKIGPQEIEAESFRIIESEFEEQTGIRPDTIDPSQFAVIRRVIHATGDFSFAATLRFHGQAIEAGLSAIRSGKNILTDVNMAKAGISASLLDAYGGKVICKVADSDIAALAGSREKTRSETAVEEGIMENVGIVAIGNAPTALLAVIKLIEQGLAHPDLVIGVPVGFVNAEESKDILHEQTFPYITSLGRKGGTTVSVAIINALLRLA